jgi:hypothetical protein
MNTKPILACAGNKSEQIDSELLNELLLNYQPNLIGIRHKAASIIYAFERIVAGEVENSYEEFKSIINREFLAIQLMEAANLARQQSAVTVDAPSDAKAL